MVTSDFRPEVEIRPFSACAMKNTQYNAHLSQNRRNSRVLKEILVFDPTYNQEIRQFCACAIKILNINADLWPNRRNFRVLKEI